MNIKVLGPGCGRCAAVEKLVKQALEELKMEATLEKVTDIKKFATYGVFMTPALIIDDQVKCSGKIPTKNDIIAWLKK